MKFTRRPDLDPHTRIEIVRLAWLYQGIYGKMTQIAQVYQIYGKYRIMVSEGGERIWSRDSMGLLLTMIRETSERPGADHQG